MSASGHQVVVVDFKGASREVNASELGESAFVVLEGKRHAVARVVETRLGRDERRIESFDARGTLLASLVQRR
jgi:hypothetical protein